MGKHKTTNDNRKKIQTPQKKSFKTKCERKKEEETVTLARCKTWLKEVKKEKAKAPTTLDTFSSDDEDFPDMSHSERTSPSLASETSNKSANRPTKRKYEIKILFACEWQKCSKVFNTYTNLVEHVQNHLETISSDDSTKQSDQNYECEWDLCNYETDEKKILICHVLYHAYHTNLKTLGEQLLHKKDPLPPCINDSRHRNMIPATESNYVCMWKKCKYKFDTIQEYFEHAKNHCIHELATHKMGKRNVTVQCQWIDCSKKFNKRLKMFEHMRTHTGERILACPNCGSTFNSYTKFHDHFRRQSITANFKCNECFHTFATEELLNNHMYGHINCIKCTMCDMTCPSQSALAQHFRYRHLKERPFKCLQCDYGAVTKWDLNKHILNRHVNEPTTFYCEEFDCDFSCTKMSAMRKHERNEHGNGPNIYCCHLCNKQYQCGWSLSKHFIKNHGFQLPLGHRRFTYRQDIDGFYRVRLTRTESLEVSEQIMSKSNANVSLSDDVLYKLSEIKKNKTGLTIDLVTKQRSRNEPAKTSTANESLVNLDTILDSTNDSDDQKYVDVDGEFSSSHEVNSVTDEVSEGKRNDLGNFTDIVINSREILRNNNSIDGSVKSEPILPRRFNINSNDQSTENSANEIVDVIPAASGSDDNSDRPLIKNINDFSMMKKYLNSTSTRTNEILITFDEIDNLGNVIHTKTRKANEIQLNNAKDTSSMSK